MTYPGCLGAWYTSLGTQTLAPKKGFLTFYLKIFFKHPFVSLFNIRNLENVLPRNLRTGTARDCIFRASGGTRFKNFHQSWWQKRGGGTPRCNWSAQENSGYITDLYHSCCHFHYPFLLFVAISVTVLVFFLSLLAFMWLMLLLLLLHHCFVLFNTY